MVRIRNLENGEYSSIKAWYPEWNSATPTEDMMPLDSTFVLEYNGEAMVCVSLLYMHDVRQFVLVENLISNPRLVNRELRKELVEMMLEHLNAHARERGIKKLFALAANPKVSKRYLNMGFQLTGTAVDTFIREVE